MGALDEQMTQITATPLADADLDLFAAVSIANRQSRMHHLSAVDIDRLSGDILRVWRGEVEGHRGELR